MFEALLESVLLHKLRLGEYIDGIDKSKLSVALWSGLITLNDLYLKRGALDKLKLPIDIKYGYLRSLTVEIPWQSIRSAPVKVKVDGLYVIAAPISHAPSSSSTDPAMAGTDADAIARALHKQDIDVADALRLAKKQSAAVDEKEAKDKSFGEALIAAIVANLQFTVFNVHIRYESHSFAAAATTGLSAPLNPAGAAAAAAALMAESKTSTTASSGSAAANNNMLEFACGMTIAEFSAQTTDRHGVVKYVTPGTADSPFIFKLVTLRSLAVYWNSNVKSWQTIKSSKAVMQLLRDNIARVDEQSAVQPPVSGTAAGSPAPPTRQGGSPTLAAAPAPDASPPPVTGGDIKGHARSASGTIAAAAVGSAAASSASSGGGARGFEYIVSPLSMTFKAVINHTRDLSQPKYSGSVQLHEFALHLTRAQYRSIVKLLDGFTSARLRHEFTRALAAARITRPAVAVKQQPRLWWRYAIECIINIKTTDATGKPRRPHALKGSSAKTSGAAEILAKRKLFQRYVALHKRRSGVSWVTKLSDAETRALDDIEQQVDVRTVLFYRTVAENELAREATNKERADQLAAAATAAAAQAQSTRARAAASVSSWLSSYFKPVSGPAPGAATDAKVTADANDAAASPAAAAVGIELTAEQKTEILSAMEANDAVTGDRKVKVYPVGYVRTRVEFALARGSTVLLEAPGIPLACAQLEAATFTLETKRDPGCWSVSSAVRSVSVVDYSTPNTLHPLLLAPKPPAEDIDVPSRPTSPGSGSELVPASSASAYLSTASLLLPQPSPTSSSSSASAGTAARAKHASPPPLLRMTLTSKPLDKPGTDLHFELDLRALQVVYNPVFTSRLYTFLSSTRDTADHLRAVASSWRDQKQSEFVQAVSGVRRGQLSLRVHVSGPTLLVPEDCRRCGANVLVATMSDFVLSSLDTAAAVTDLTNEPHALRTRRTPSASNAAAAAGAATVYSSMTDSIIMGITPPALHPTLAAQDSLIVAGKRNVLLDPVRDHPHSYDAFSLHMAGVQLQLIMQQPRRVLPASTNAAAATAATVAEEVTAASVAQLLSAAVVDRIFDRSSSNSSPSASSSSAYVLVTKELLDRFDLRVNVYANVDTSLQQTVHEHGAGAGAASKSGTVGGKGDDEKLSAAAIAKLLLPRVIVQSSLPQITFRASSSVYYALLNMRKRITEIKRDYEKARDTERQAQVAAAAAAAADAKTRAERGPAPPVAAAALLPASRATVVEAANAAAAVSEGTTTPAAGASAGAAAAAGATPAKRPASKGAAGSGGDPALGVDLSARLKLDWEFSVRDYTLVVADDVEDDHVTLRSNPTPYVRIWASKFLSRTQVTRNDIRYTVRLQSVRMDNLLPNPLFTNPTLTPFQCIASSTRPKFLRVRKQPPPLLPRGPSSNDAYATPRHAGSVGPMGSVAATPKTAGLSGASTPGLERPSSVSDSDEDVGPRGGGADEFQDAKAAPDVAVADDDDDNDSAAFASENEADAIALISYRYVIPPKRAPGDVGPRVAPVESDLLDFKFNTLYAQWNPQEVAAYVDFLRKLVPTVAATPVATPPAAAAAAPAASAAAAAPTAAAATSATAPAVGSAGAAVAGPPAPAASSSAAALSSSSSSSGSVLPGAATAAAALSYATSTKLVVTASFERLALFFNKPSTARRLACVQIKKLSVTHVMARRGTFATSARLDDLTVHDLTHISYASLLVANSGSNKPAAAADEKKAATPPQFPRLPKHYQIFGFRSTSSSSAAAASATAAADNINAAASAEEKSAAAGSATAGAAASAVASDERPREPGVQLSITSFEESASDYPGYGSDFQFRSGSGVRFVYVQQFVLELFDYVMEGVLGALLMTSQKQVAKKVPKFNKWGVDMWHPLILMPRNVYSNSFVQFDLGRVRANSLTTVTPLTRTNSWPLHERIDIAVQQMSLSAFVDYAEDDRLDLIAGAIMAHATGNAPPMAYTTLVLPTNQFADGDRGLTALWDREIRRERAQLGVGSSGGGVTATPLRMAASMMPLSPQPSLIPSVTATPAHPPHSSRAGALPPSAQPSAKVWSTLCRNADMSAVWWIPRDDVDAPPDPNATSDAKPAPASAGDVPLVAPTAISMLPMSATPPLAGADDTKQPIAKPTTAPAAASDAKAAAAAVPPPLHHLRVPSVVIAVTPSGAPSPHGNSSAAAGSAAPAPPVPGPGSGAYGSANFILPCHTGPIIKVEAEISKLRVDLTLRSYYLLFQLIGENFGAPPGYLASAPVPAPVQPAAAVASSDNATLVVAAAAPAAASPIAVVPLDADEKSPPLPADSKAAAPAAPAASPIATAAPASDSGNGGNGGGGGGVVYSRVVYKHNNPLIPSKTFQLHFHLRQVQVGMLMPDRLSCDAKSRPPPPQPRVHHAGAGAGGGAASNMGSSLSASAYLSPPMAPRSPPVVAPLSAAVRAATELVIPICLFTVDAAHYAFERHANGGLVSYLGLTSMSVRDERPSQARANALFRTIMYPPPPPPPLTNGQPAAGAGGTGTEEFSMRWRREPQDPTKDSVYDQSISFALRHCYMLLLPDFMIDLLTFLMAPPPFPNAVTGSVAGVGGQGAPPPQTAHSSRVDARTGQRVHKSVSQNKVDVSLHASRAILLEDETRADSKAVVVSCDASTKFMATQQFTQIGDTGPVELMQANKRFEANVTKLQMFVCRARQAVQHQHAVVHGTGSGKPPAAAAAAASVAGDSKLPPAGNAPRPVPAGLTSATPTNRYLTTATSSSSSGSVGGLHRIPSDSELVRHAHGGTTGSGSSNHHPADDAAWSAHSIVTPCDVECELQMNQSTNSNTRHGNAVIDAVEVHASYYDLKLFYAIARHAAKILAGKPKGNAVNDSVLKAPATTADGALPAAQASSSASHAGAAVVDEDDDDDLFRPRRVVSIASNSGNNSAASLSGSSVAPAGSMVAAASPTSNGVASANGSGGAATTVCPVLSFEVRCQSLSLLLINDCHGASAGAALYGSVGAGAATTHVPLLYIRVPNCHVNVDGDKTGLMRTDVSLSAQCNFYNLALAEWVAVTDLTPVTCQVLTQTLRHPLMIPAASAGATSGAGASGAGGTEQPNPRGAPPSQHIPGPSAITTDDYFGGGNSGTRKAGAPATTTVAAGGAVDPEMERALKLSHATFRDEQDKRKAADAAREQAAHTMHEQGFVASATHSVVSHTLGIQVDFPQPLEMCVSHDLLGAMYRTWQSWQQEYTRNLVVPRTVPLSAYFVRNQTGVPISYWHSTSKAALYAPTPVSASGSNAAPYTPLSSTAVSVKSATRTAATPSATPAHSGGSGRGEVHNVPSGAELVLHVTHPHERVSLGVQIASHGTHWLSLDDVVVSRVGVHAYQLTRDPRHPSAVVGGGAGGRAAGHVDRISTVVVDVSLRDGNKVVTFRSPVSFYNETALSLEFRVTYPQPINLHVLHSAGVPMSGATPSAAAAPTSARPQQQQVVRVVPAGAAVAPGTSSGLARAVPVGAAGSGARPPSASPLSVARTSSVSQQHAQQQHAQQHHSYSVTFGPIEPKQSICLPLDASLAHWDALYVRPAQEFGFVWSTQAILYTKLRLYNDKFNRDHALWKRRQLRRKRMAAEAMGTTTGQAAALNDVKLSGPKQPALVSRTASATSAAGDDSSDDDGGDGAASAQASANITDHDSVDDSQHELAVLSCRTGTGGAGSGTDAKGAAAAGADRKQQPLQNAAIAQRAQGVGANESYFVCHVRVGLLKRKLKVPVRTGMSTSAAAAAAAADVGVFTELTVHLHPPLTINNLLPVPLNYRIVYPAQQAATAQRRVGPNGQPLPAPAASEAVLVTQGSLEAGQHVLLHDTFLSRSPAIQYVIGGGFQVSKWQGVHHSTDMVMFTQPQPLQPVTPSTPQGAKNSGTPSLPGLPPPPSQGTVAMCDPVPLWITQDSQQNKQSGARVVNVYTRYWLNNRAELPSLQFGTADTVYENQRHLLMDWRDPMLPSDPGVWSDKQGESALPPKSRTLPPGGEWRWLSDWSVDKQSGAYASAGGTDSDGWQYASDWTSKNWTRTAPSVQGVRRRKWTRTRILVPMLNRYPNFPPNFLNASSGGGGGSRADVMDVFGRPLQAHTLRMFGAKHPPALSLTLHNTHLSKPFPLSAVTHSASAAAAAAANPSNVDGVLSLLERAASGTYNAQTRTTRRRAYDLAVQFDHGPAQFYRTKVITILPRFVLVNRLRTGGATNSTAAATTKPAGDAKQAMPPAKRSANRTLLIAQDGVGDDIVALAPDAVQGWYRSDHTRPPQIRIAFEGWRWSERFPVDQVGEFTVKFEQRPFSASSPPQSATSLSSSPASSPSGPTRAYFVRVKITLDRATLRVEFRREHPHRPTYRIDNHLAFPIWVAQAAPAPPPVGANDKAPISTLLSSGPPPPKSVVGSGLSHVWAWTDLNTAPPLMLSISFSGDSTVPVVVSPPLSGSSRVSLSAAGGAAGAKGAAVPQAGAPPPPQQLHSHLSSAGGAAVAMPRSAAGATPTAAAGNDRKQLNAHPNSLRAPPPVQPCRFENCALHACLMHVPFEHIGFTRSMRITITTKQPDGSVRAELNDVDVVVSTDGPTRVLTIRARSAAEPKPISSSNDPLALLPVGKSQQQQQVVVTTTRHRSIVVAMKGLGVVLQDKRRRDILYAHIAPISVSHLVAPDAHTLNVRLGTIQVDSTALNPTFPIVLSSHPAFVARATKAGTSSIDPNLNSPDLYFLDFVMVRKPPPEEGSIEAASGAGAALASGGRLGPGAATGVRRGSVASSGDEELPDDWELLSVSEFRLVQVRLSPVRLQLEESLLRNVVQLAVDSSAIFRPGANGALNGMGGTGMVLLTGPELAFVLATEQPIDLRWRQLFPGATSPGSSDATTTTGGGLKRVLSAASLAALTNTRAGSSVPGPPGVLGSQQQQQREALYFFDLFEIGPLKIKFTFLRATAEDRAAAAAAAIMASSGGIAGSSISGAVGQVAGSTASVGGGIDGEIDTSSATGARGDYWDHLLDTTGLDGFLTNIDDASLSLTGHRFRNRLGTASGLVAELRDAYQKQIKAQALGIIGSAQFLGNPMALYRSLSNGFHDFLTEPLSALSQGEDLGDLAAGVSKGTLSLAKNSVFGISNAASHITQSVSNTLALLSADKAYIAARETRMRADKPEDALEGVLFGVKQLGTGVVQGVTGVFALPFQGAMEDGATGLVGGLLRGAVGLVVKPVTGAVDAVSKFTQGVRNTATIFEHTVPTLQRRLRPKLSQQKGLVDPTSAFQRHSPFAPPGTPSGNAIDSAIMTVARASGAAGGGGGGASVAAAAGAGAGRATPMAAARAGAGTPGAAGGAAAPAAGASARPPPRHLVVSTEPASDFVLISDYMPDGKQSAGGAASRGAAAPSPAAAAAAAAPRSGGVSAAAAAGVVVPVPRPVGSAAAAPAPARAPQGVAAVPVAAAAAAPPDWMCAQCTFRNSGWLPHCEKCSAPHRQHPGGLRAAGSVIGVAHPVGAAPKR